VLVRRLATEYAPKAADKAPEFRAVPRASQALSDSALLERALRNLIKNALRYTPEVVILLGVRRRGELVRIDVIDSGVGIPADKQAEIFEEFHHLNNPGRNLEQGLGLGLAIVARLANLLGAQIEVASRVGQGSRFSLSLPLVYDAASEFDGGQIAIRAAIGARRSAYLVRMVEAHILGWRPKPPAIATRKNVKHSDAAPDLTASPHQLAGFAWRAPRRLTHAGHPN
jgi:hypothetical protein